jgi:hypothetical protein
MERVSLGLDPARVEARPARWALPSADRPSARTRAPWIPAALLGSIILLRVLTLSRTGLFNYEAYYWAWSRHLALSYFITLPPSRT